MQQRRKEQKGNKKWKAEKKERARRNLDKQRNK
jgi:hypothetical protein